MLDVEVSKQELQSPNFLGGLLNGLLSLVASILNGLFDILNIGKNRIASTAKTIVGQVTNTLNNLSTVNENSEPAKMLKKVIEALTKVLNSSDLANCLVESVTKIAK